MKPLRISTIALYILNQTTAGISNKDFVWVSWRRVGKTLGCVQNVDSIMKIRLL